MQYIELKNKLRDFTIFYRGYRIGLIKKALSVYGDKFITSGTFFSNAEALINLLPLAGKVVEIPLVYDYGIKIGHSKMPVFKTLLDYLGFFGKHFARRYLRR